MQEIFNLVPNLNNPELLKAFMVRFDGFSCAIVEGR